jgi:hypothetical protein
MKKLKSAILLDVTLCNSVEGYHNSVGTCYFHPLPRHSFLSHSQLKLFQHFERYVLQFKVVFVLLTSALV